MAYGENDKMRTVHLPALKRSDAPKGGVGCKKDKVNVQKYIDTWNASCAKGERLGQKEHTTLCRWLRGDKGSNFEYSQTGVAKRSRRRRNRQKEGKKVVETTDTFVFE